MKAISTTTAIFIAVCLFAFYITTLHSWLYPYIPSKISFYFFLTVLGFMPVGAFCVGFFIKYRSDGNLDFFTLGISSKKEKIKRWVRFILALPIGLSLLVYVCGRWFAYPTKIFADEDVAAEVTCIKTSALGYSFRNRKMLHLIDDATHEEWELPWPTDQIPDCPSKLKLSGRTWVWGIYVTDIQPIKGGSDN